MTSVSIRDWVRAAMDEVVHFSDELTELDAACGDGDLGFTLLTSASAVSKELAVINEASSITDVLRVSASAVARGNPSSFAALIAAGASAAAQVMAERQGETAEDLADALDAGVNVIASRGRSKPGDRTVLDALVPSIDALRATSPGEGLDAMIEAAREGTRRTADMTPRRGRAAWGGDRVRGTPDAGATAYTRFLEALRKTQPQ